MKTLLWLDDIRDPSEGNWFSFNPIDSPFITVWWVKDYGEFTKWIENNGLPAGICFDHDLGMSKQQEKTGYDCVKWLVEYCIVNRQPLPKWNVQSANPVGKDNINGLLNNFLKHSE